MVKRKANPFTLKRRQLPHRTLLRREAPLLPADRRELEEACTRIAGGPEGYLMYAGSKGEENDCKVICFATREQAQAMAAWIAASGIETRAAPASDPNLAMLRVG